MDGWTTIAARNDTKRRLRDMKQMKKHGKPENYDDVIRRGMNMPDVPEVDDDIDGEVDY